MALELDADIDSANLGASDATVDLQAIFLGYSNIVDQSGNPVPREKLIFWCYDPVSGTKSLTIPAQPISTQPIPGTNYLGTIEGQAASVPVAKVLSSASSPSGGVLNIAAVNTASAQGGTVSLADGLVSYTPPPDYTGPDQFTYTLSDGISTAQGTVFVTVTPTNSSSLNLVSLTMDSNGWLIQFAGIPGEEYLIQWADTPTGPWSNLTNNPLLPDVTGIIEYTDTTQPVPTQRYYRTVLAP